MRNIYSLILTFIVTTVVIAQSPQLMSYQAVIRDASGHLVTTQVGMKISILQGSPTGTPVFVETQTPTPGANGLVSTEIGSGIPVIGTFSSIIWSAGPYFIKTETDPTGGTTYTITGTSQLLSVPYALYSKTSETTNDAVKLSGNQTITGNKTFSGSVRVLTPVNTTDASNKSYVDVLKPRFGILKENILAAGTYSVGIDYLKQFFDNVYSGTKYFKGLWCDINIKSAFPLYFGLWDQKYTFESVTDASDQGRYMEGQLWKSGKMADSIVSKMTWDCFRNPFLESMLTVIRISNITLKNIRNIKDGSETDKNDLNGQAYFTRAFCHFALMNLWGPMPYINNVIGITEQWNMFRLSKHECLTRIAQDFDSAYYFFNLAGKIRRDPPLGSAGHLNYFTNEMYRPNGMAAKGYQARALLFRASPLNTEGDPNDWKEAAAVSWKALQVALNDGGLSLLPMATRKQNFLGMMVCDESLWTYSFGNLTWNGGFQTGTTRRGLASLFNGAFGLSPSWSGVCPTQNFVDKYETSLGLPIWDVASTYNPQNPYVNRDPRLVQDIIYNQSPCQSYGSGADYGSANNTAQIFYWNESGTIKQSELLTKATYPGMTYTGYYLRKFWWNNSIKNPVPGILTDPLMRLAEVYLNYAEAANEAYGPNTPAPGASLTAVQAVNAVRTRAGMPGVPAAYTGNTADFRPRIKNERNIELAFEGHYYNDIRRWMDLQTIMSGTLCGMDIERLTLSPLVFKYTTLPLPADRQPVWKPQMYYLPFNNSDNLKMTNFVPNPAW